MLAVDEGLHECVAIRHMTGGNVFIGLCDPLAQQLQFERFQCIVFIGGHEYGHWFAVAADLDWRLLRLYQHIPELGFGFVSRYGSHGIAFV